LIYRKPNVPTAMKYADDIDVVSFDQKGDRRSASKTNKAEAGHQIVPGTTSVRKCTEIQAVPVDLFHIDPGDFLARILHDVVEEIFKIGCRCGCKTDLVVHEVRLFSS